MPRSTARDCSLLLAWAVCRSLVHSEQPRELGACTGSGGMLAGRNLWARGSGSPLSWGKFPCPTPPWLFPRAQNPSLCREKEMPRRSPWVSTPRIHYHGAPAPQFCVFFWCYTLFPGKILVLGCATRLSAPCSAVFGAVNAGNSINYGGRRAGWNERQKASRAQSLQRTCIKGRLLY